MNGIGRFVDVGRFDDGDPFLDESKWKQIVADVQAEFPDYDLILFRVGDGYTGLASISESLDPMKLAMDMIPRGFMCIGTNKKVNLMTNLEMKEIVDQITESL